MIYFDSRNVECKKPFGPVKCGEEVHFCVTFDKEESVYANVWMIIYQLDKREISVCLRRTEQKEHTLFTGSFIPENTGLYFYYFRIESENTVRYLKKPENGGSVASLGYGDKDKVYQMTVYDAALTTPEEFKGKIMYQIFPDRFRFSGKRKKDIPEGRILRSDWGGAPFYIPDVNGELNRDYFCGDLQGIQEKLPYLKELGVSYIYLNPIFESHSNHRYDTADYEKIDPLLGTNEDFVEICEAADELGIGFILDGVFSHTGADSRYFNRYYRYGSEGAFNSKDSPFTEWYNFTHWPEKYDSWWGFENMPNVKENTPSYVNYICGENGIIHKWIQLGAMGFRLDVADELPDSFIREIRKAVKREGNDKILYGEVWEDASNKESYGELREYLFGQELDSVMNYPFKNAILQYLMDKNADAFQETIMIIVENYPKPCLDVAMNSLSTHDTIRAITVLAGENVDYNDRQTQSHKVLSLDSYDKGKRLLKLAMVLQYFLPGIPCIYYGDEAGLQGYRDPFNRKCYPWGYEDTELVEFVKMLGKLRLSCSTLATGRLQFMIKDNTGFLSFKRIEGDKETYIFLNTSETQEVSVSTHGLEDYKVLYGQQKGGIFIIPKEDFLILSKE